MELLRRHPENPILTPRADVPWEKEAVFNPGVTVHQGKIYMLYRAIGEYEVYASSLGLAISEDGVHFQRFPEPVFSPAEPYDRYGCEDPRITRLDGRFYITYTALSQRAFSGRGNRVALASTEDFREFKRHGVILPDLDDKDTVIFPEKVRGRYVMYHRVPPDIWIAYSDDLVNWYGHRRIMFPRSGLWDSQKIGAGAPPIRTDAGWLLVYHGVDKNRVYRLGVALFDLDDPSQLISRPLEPILEPRERYEKEGDVPNVVFTCGLAEADEKIFVYYGGGDKVIGLATVERKELLDFALRG
ncbi:glycosidase [bacterium]|nr:glycosidase [bacterium]